MELNREQIIKALECCITDSCFSCPYDNVGVYSQCAPTLLEDALSLIKELTEENERLAKAKYIFATVDYCSDDLAKALDENKMLTEENERLENALIEQSAENVMLCGEVKHARADTVRKLTEMLTTFFANDETLEYTEVDAEYINEQISRITEEIMGEV